MTSQVNPNNIDGTYPIAGQDNDSQGFRDNFTNIRNNLTYIKAEVEDLQSKAVFKTALTNTTLDNNLQGNAIVGASLTGYRETYNNIGSVSGSTTIDFTNGNFQKITMSGSTILSFSFPDSASGQYSSIKLWVSNSNAGYTLTLPSACTLGDPDTIAGLAGTTPPVITFSSAEIANNTNFLFEFFTVDKGVTIGIRDLIRNRDVDLSGLSITGNLALDNISASGNVVTTNGIFWSGNGQPFSIAGGGAGSFSTITASSTFIGTGNIVAAATTASTDSTTGALVVKGGAGIAANVNIDGNLFINSGNIRSASLVANIFNVTATTISMGNAAANMFLGASSGNVRIGGNLILPNSSTSVVPLSFGATATTGGNVNVPIQGAIEANIGVGAAGTAANVFYATPANATSSGRALIPVQHTYVLGGNTSMNGGVAFTGAAEYPVFGGPVTAGAWVGNVMLSAGTTYEFELKAMGAFAAASTSSTLALRFVGNATVTYSNYETMVVGVGGTTTTAPSVTEHFGTTTLPITTAAGAAVYTNFMIRAKGIIKINGQGTLNPCYVFATGPAQVLTAVQGSYMKWTPLGTASNIAIGTIMGGAWAGGVGY
jgi:hypothetical protein